MVEECHAPRMPLSVLCVLEVTGEPTLCIGAGFMSRFVVTPVGLCSFCLLERVLGQISRSLLKRRLSLSQILRNAGSLQCWQLYFRFLAADILGMLREPFLSCQRGDVELTGSRNAERLVATSFTHANRPYIDIVPCVHFFFFCQRRPRKRARNGDRAACDSSFSIGGRCVC